MKHLPPQLTLLLDTAIGNVQHGDPAVHPTPQVRKAIYEAFGERHDARAWQGILAARRVLPIFQQAFPDELLPQQMLDAAERVLQGTITHEEAHKFWDQGYHTVGGYWSDDDEYIEANADLVGEAAWRALSGVWGHYFLQDLDTGYGQRVVDETGTVDYRLITGDEWTNDLLYRFSGTDTVLHAAGATMRDPETGRWNKDKLRAFWLWWLKEAIPLAWETALANSSTK